MPEIRVLEREIADKIAAGEVVERPGSVVKELVENALDAGAQAITVEIRSGGITYIRVTDDGCGMNRENAQRCFLRHATSKIRDIADLYAIETLGFRGEALAAISAVSRVELITAEEGAIGTRITLEGGKELAVEDAGAPRGTTMIVRDLFFNTPARMKFLKTDRSEAANIAALMERLAISNPQVAFRLLNENKTLLSTSGNGSLLDVIYSVMGKEIAGSMLQADAEIEHIRVYGYVGEPTVTKSTRNYQLCFINGRLVRSQTVFAAIDQAYHNELFHGRQAVCVLKINMPFGLVDVNVHPSKMEVKFSNEKRIFEAVYYAIKGALNKQTLLNRSPAAQEAPPVKREEAPIVQAFERPEPLIPSMPQAAPSAPQKISDDVILTLPPKRDFKMQSKNTLHEDLPPIAPPEPQPQPEQAAISEPLEKELPYRYVGEIFSAFVLIESGDTLYLLDKHAAHERMIFNRLLKEYQSGERVGQELLIPEEVQLSPEELLFAEENSEAFARVGFDLDVFGDRKILLRSRPVALSDESTAEAFSEILSQWMKGGKRAFTERENTALKTVACKAAIKAGMLNDSSELKALVTELIRTDEVHQCPHGRPVMIAYTKKMIEKDFLRI